MKNFLVGVDFSKHSANALQQGARLAARAGGNLHALYVITPDAIEDIQAFRPVPTDRILADAQARLDVFINDQLDLKNIARSSVQIGSPREQLCVAAGEIKPDLILMGSSGETKEPHTVGMVATHCIRRPHSPPILLVRGDHRDAFKKVVVCVDFSTTSEAALRLGIQTAKAEDSTTLHVVHSHNPPWLRPTSIIYNLTQSITTEEKKAYIQKLKTRMDAFIAPYLPDLETLSYEIFLPERSHAAYAITDHLRSSGADLAVLGTRARSPVGTFFLGTTAERLIQKSPCSVLAVKPPE